MGSLFHGGGLGVEPAKDHRRPAAQARCRSAGNRMGDPCLDNLSSGVSSCHGPGDRWRGSGRCLSAGFGLIYSHVNWFGLTVESTLDEPYNADYAICAFRGPVIYSQQYGLLLPRSDADFGIMLGERQILVSMVAASKTSFFVSRDNYPNIGPGSRSFPHDKKMIYLSTTQTDAMTTDDKMVWCRAGPDLHKLVDDLHLTLDDHGVILGDRITWISGGGIPATNLMQRPSQEAQEAVEEALR